MISAVAEMYDIHPQTLRLYEREGLLIPSRSDGNTRLYTQGDLDQLEVILNLTRELGVNLAGIDVIMNMRRRMRQMQEEMQAFVDNVQKEFGHHVNRNRESSSNALVRINPLHIVRARNSGKTS
jgi:MerR family transcriptional regulator/heat shock protein HspR